MYGKAKSPAGEEVRGGGERRRQEWLKTGVYLLVGVLAFAFGLWRSFEARDSVVNLGERLPPWQMQLENKRRGAKPRVFSFRCKAELAAGGEPGIEAAPLLDLPPEVRSRLGAADGGRLILLVAPNLEVIFASRFLRVPLTEKMPEAARLRDLRGDWRTFGGIFLLGIPSSYTSSHTTPL